MQYLEAEIILVRDADVLSSSSFRIPVSQTEEAQEMSIFSHPVTECCMRNKKRLANAGLPVKFRYRIHQPRIV